MSLIEEFRQSLSELGAASTVVFPDEFESEMAGLIEEPAVAAELSFDSVSLSNVPVTLDPSTSQVKNAATGVTESRMGISSLGTVAVESSTNGEEYIALYPERHVVVIRASDLRSNLSDAFTWLQAEFEAGRQSFILATGPSSTGDMGALVKGVHGPEQVHVVIIKNNE